MRPLKELTVKIEGPQPLVIEHDTMSVEDFIGSLVYETGPELAMLDADSVALEAQHDTIDQLMALKATISKFGLSRALLSFADHDKTLSSVITAIPSSEALIADRSAKNSQDVVAALEASIGEMFAVYVRTLKKRISNAIHTNTQRKAMLTKEMVRLSVINDFMKQPRTYNEEKAKSKQFTLTTAADMHAAIDLQKKAHALIKQMTDDHLPATEAEFTPWLAKRRTEFDALEPFHGTTINEYGRWERSGKELALPKRDTLHGAGYTSLDDFHKLYPAIATMEKSTDDYEKFWDKLLRLFETAHYDNTLKYLEKAVNIDFSILLSLCGRTYWLCDHGIGDVLKAIFACSDKAKKE